MYLPYEKSSVVTRHLYYVEEDKNNGRSTVRKPYEPIRSLISNRGNVKNDVTPFKGIPERHSVFNEVMFGNNMVHKLDIIA